MVEYVLIGILSILFLIILFFRVNTAIMFLALCAGSVLIGASGDSAGLLASSLTSGMNFAANYAKIALLLLPAILVGIFTRGRAKKSLFIFNVASASLVIFSALIFIYKFLPNSISDQVGSTQIWAMTSDYQEFIIGAGLLLSVLLIYLTNKQPKNKKDKKH